jgi:hypothetical protein
MQTFIEGNKFPLMRKLDSGYIKRLQKEEKTLIMVAISVKNSVHVGFVENILSEVSIKNRKYVFAFIDIDQDSYLVNYFKINANDLPKVIIYDFKEKVFYVDNESNSHTVYENEESSMRHLQNLINLLQNNKLKWSTGNMLEDILAKFGLRLNQATMTYILGGCFALIVVIMIIVIFYCGENNEEDERKAALEHLRKEAEAAASKLTNADTQPVKDNQETKPEDKKNQ